MTTIDPNRLEIIRIARELILSEYYQRCSKIHNEWAVQSDIAWTNKGIHIQYPHIPDFPTEQDILSRAQSLLEFASVQKSLPNALRQLPQNTDFK